MINPKPYLTAEQEEVIRKVRVRMDEYVPRGFRLELLADPQSVRQEEDWWYLVVQPIPASVRSDRYAEALSDISEQLREKDHVKVLLVPTLATNG